MTLCDGRRSGLCDARGQARRMYSPPAFTQFGGKTMKLISKLAAAAAVSACAWVAAPASAQEPGRAIVSLYHAVPGQQEALLRWMADQDRAAAAAGVAPSQVYVHTDGDSWDYMVVNPVTTDAQDAAVEAAAKKMGISYGMRASLDFRKYISSHTDTFVRGPTTAAQILSALPK